MRVLHVTPHLPPDQAANALLPWQLGTWAAQAGDEVEYVAHPPRAAGRVTIAAARSRGCRAGTRRFYDRVVPLGAFTRQGLRIRRALTPALARRRPRSRPQQRPARRTRRADVATATETGHPHAVRHRDLALRAEARPARSVHARLPRRVGGDVLQRAPARASEGTGSDASCDARRLSRPSPTCSAGTTRRINWKHASRWASRTGTCS